MFHGIEELRRDGQGFVYWRDISIEHYSYPDDDAGQEREAEAARKLRGTCFAIEARGQPVSSAALWHYRIFSGCRAPLVDQVAGLCIAERFGLDGACDAPWIANTIAREGDGWEPYFTSDGGRYVFVKTDACGERSDSGHAVRQSGPAQLTVDELRAVTDRPWPGHCATTGATMRDFADAVAGIDAPGWMKRAAVSLCRSYATCFATSVGNWRSAIPDIVAIIRDINAAFG